jgi:hypothetical protein
MKATVLLEYYRQFGFVSSVLGGFAFTLFGVLLPVSVKARAAGLAAFLGVAASIAFLLVTLGMTFAAAVAASLPPNTTMPASIVAQQTPLSFCFLIGMGLLLASFGVGGWIHSRFMGIATVILAAVGAFGVLLVLIPFLH